MSMFKNKNPVTRLSHRVLKIDRNKPYKAGALLSGLRFSSGMAIETTNPASRMALVNEETTMVRLPLIKYVKIIKNPKK